MQLRRCLRQCKGLFWWLNIIEGVNNIAADVLSWDRLRVARSVLADSTMVRFLPHVLVARD